MTQHKPNTTIHNSYTTLTQHNTYAQVLDALSEPLHSVLCKKPKENASPQDIERHNELQRSAMTTVVVLHRMEDSHTCHKFQSMYENILSDPKLRELLESVTSADGEVAQT